MKYLIAFLGWKSGSIKLITIELRRLGFLALCFFPIIFHIILYPKNKYS